MLWMLEIKQDKGIRRLKDKNKKLTPYKDNEFTYEARDQIRHINRHLEVAVIDLDLNDKHVIGLLKKLRRVDIDDNEKHLSLFTHKCLYRIFSNSSFNLHRRFYDPFWQQLPGSRQTVRR